MTLDTSKFRELFCSEAEENIAALSSTLLSLERNPTGGEAYDALMRYAHTIKGNAATMGYVKMAYLAHVLEDVFDYARNGLITPDSALISELLVAVDALGGSLALVCGGKEEGELGTIADELKLKSGVTTSGIGASRRTSDGKPAPLVGDVPPSESTPPPSPEAASLHQDIESPLPGVSPQKNDAELAKRMIDAEQAFKLATRTELAHVRVPIERLDHMLGLLEELLIVKMKLESLVEPISATLARETRPEIRKQLELVASLGPLVQDLSRLVNETEYSIMRARLVSLEHIFGRFPRMVRDLSVLESKQIDLVASGSDVELDRVIVEKLGGALAHLIRNAVDHGIAKEGRIRMYAQRVKDRVRVVVEDNGEGINYDAVRALALSKGLLTGETAPGATIETLNNLLFSSHFSTNQEVTEVSGRGVGLASVKAFAREVGGRVMVESPIDGGGTRFTLELPMSVAVVHVLLVSTQSLTFAFSFSDVERSVRIRASEIFSGAGHDVAVIDGAPVPIFFLADLLNVRMTSVVDASDHVLDVVVVHADNNVVGFVVDACIGEEELLIKSIPSVLRNVKGFSGSALLGDGRTVLLLEPNGLLALSRVSIMNTHETP